jgi:hypothetical protein
LFSISVSEGVKNALYLLRPAPAPKAGAFYCLCCDASGIDILRYH